MGILAVVGGNLCLLHMGIARADCKNQDRGLLLAAHEQNPGRVGRALAKRGQTGDMCTGDLCLLHTSRTWAGRWRGVSRTWAGRWQGVSQAWAGREQSVDTGRAQHEESWNTAWA